LAKLDMTMLPGKVSGLAFESHFSWD